MSKIEAHEEQRYLSGEETPAVPKQPFLERMLCAIQNAVYVVDQRVPIGGIARALHLTRDTEAQDADGMFLD